MDNKLLVLIDLQNDFINKNTKNIFLFLYLLMKNGNPFFFSILTLHLFFLSISFIFLNSDMLILHTRFVDFFLLIFHKNIPLFKQLFINLSIK